MGELGLERWPDRLPVEEDLERFALPVSTERFTPAEQRYLRPFFSNLDQSVFVVRHLPEEVIGALSSRYSRSTQGLRRMFLDEYVLPLLHPKHHLSATSTDADVAGHAAASQAFERFVRVIGETSGIDEVVNVQRGRRFFERWLAQFGDDSIAEMGGVHLCVEGLSNLASGEIEDKRIGLSPLEKSSRYVSFLDRGADGGYRYVIPGEIRGTTDEAEYRAAMDELFSTFAAIADPYLDDVRVRYPRGDEETERSFQSSRAAKRFDDLRDLLPFATQTNLALFGNGRAFEDLVNRLLGHPLGELRWLGQAITRELDQVVPSFVRRVQTRRGADVRVYRSNLRRLRQQLADEVLGTTPTTETFPRWARLLAHTPEADVAILTAFLYGGAQPCSLESVRGQVMAMSAEQRARCLARILAERSLGQPDAERAAVRFRKVPRAFENAHYWFELGARGGDYRDLHRHRLLTQERQRFTTRWGYDLEPDLRASPFAPQVEAALTRAATVAERLVVTSPDVAQYAIPFAFLQRWYVHLTAREIYWLIELRTGPQGRPHYREVCQQVAELARATSPSVFAGLRVDTNQYPLARREAERRKEEKLAEHR